MRGGQSGRAGRGPGGKLGQPRQGGGGPGECVGSVKSAWTCSPLYFPVPDTELDISWAPYRLMSNE